MASMLPAADEIADAVHAQLSALGEECSGEIVCVVALAMIRGCCRALKDRCPQDESMLAGWIAEVLGSEGIGGAVRH